MKKNILSASSLSLSLVIISSPLAGMMRPEDAVTEYHPISTSSIGTTSTSAAELPEVEETEADFTKFPFLANLIEELMPATQSVTQDKPDAMLQSVMLPTTPKAMGFAERIRSYVFSNSSNVIKHLTDKTFDIENAAHFDLLNAAIKEAADNYDSKTIAAIIDLCHSTQDYKNGIRINDEVAASALNASIIELKYVNAAKQANDTIEQSLQEHKAKYNEKTMVFTQALALLINGYKKDISDISDSFTALQERETARVQNPILNLGALNKLIRKDTVAVIEQDPVNVSKEIAKTLDRTNRQLEFLPVITDKMPKMKIKELEAQASK